MGYVVRVQNGAVIITQGDESAASPATVQSTGDGFVLKSGQLGSSFAARTAGNSNSASGSGTNPGVGSGSNPQVGSGSNPQVGSGSNPQVGSGSNPGVGSGGGLGAGAVIIVLGSNGEAVRSGPSFPFQIETQEESDWCWAAVSAGVDRYFDPGSYLTQCQIASDVLNEQACADPDNYNRAGSLQDALNVVGMERTSSAGKITFQALQTEIDAGRPVCVRIAWDGGGAHFVALCGYRIWSNGLKTVDVADPYYADSTQAFDQFPASYNGGGTWTDTYFTI